MIRMFIQDWWYLNWKMERRNVHNVHTKCTQYVWSMMSYVTMSKQNWKCKHQNGRFITRKLFESLKFFLEIFKNFPKFSGIIKKRNVVNKMTLAKSMNFLKRMIMNLVRRSGHKMVLLLTKSINPRRVEFSQILK